MRRRLFSRLTGAAITLTGTSLVVFAITHAIPADPAAALAGPHADQETRERIRRELGLDDPLWQQYVRYLGKALHGDLGRSFVTEESVSEALWTRFPTTAALALGSVAVWLLLGVPLGVLTAKVHNSPLDHAVHVVCLIGISLPTFWLGRLLQFHLAYRGGYFPVAGFLTWRHLLLPSLTLGIIGAGYYARLVHTNLVEVLQQDYIRTARAKGLPERVVLFKHALRNALLPVLTVLGTDTAALLGGVVFTENIFALPGLGALAVQAVLSVDVPMIMGTVLFSTVIVVGTNLAVDLVYGMVDPRIQAS
jgi:peptide/nickel transport system permease protein